MEETKSEMKYELTAKSALEHVFEVLNARGGVFNHPSNEQYNEARNLWNILTALRGPDDGNEFLKERTTQRLRGALGTNPYFQFALVSNQPLIMPEREFAKALNVQPHFLAHFEKALNSLEEVLKIKHTRVSVDPTNDYYTPARKNLHLFVTVPSPRDL